MFDPDAIIARTRTEAAQLQLRNALVLQAEHKRRLSKFNPPPHKNSSKPGEYPRARTYNLRDAVVIEPASLAIIEETGSVRVGVLIGAKYVESLVKKGRLGLANTHADLKAAGKYRE